MTFANKGVTDAFVLKGKAIWLICCLAGAPKIQMVQNILTDVFEVTINLTIGITKDNKALLSKKSIPFLVGCNTCFLIVL